MSLTEQSITRRLMLERWRKTFCLPNYTPADWWECDMFEITKAGYFREYEVKLTMQDFLRDPEKKRDVGKWQPGVERPTETKHSLLKQGDKLGPVEFYYVAPAGIIPHSQIPAWAGLIEVDFDPTATSRYHRITERRVMEAPRLHSTRLRESVYEHARGVCYWRLHALLHS